MACVFLFLCCVLARRRVHKTALKFVSDSWAQKNTRRNWSSKTSSVLLEHKVIHRNSWLTNDELQYIDIPTKFNLSWIWGRPGRKVRTFSLFRFKLVAVWFHSTLKSRNWLRHTFSIFWYDAQFPDFSLCFLCIIIDRNFVWEKFYNKNRIEVFPSWFSQSDKSDSETRELAHMEKKSMKRWLQFCACDTNCTLRLEVVLCTFSFAKKTIKQRKIVAFIQFNSHSLKQRSPKSFAGENPSIISRSTEVAPDIVFGQSD